MNREFITDSLFDKIPFILHDSTVILNKIRDAGKNSTNTDLELNTQLARCYINYLADKNNSVALNAIDSMAEVLRISNPNVAARALHILGNAYMNRYQNYEKAFHYYLLLESLAREKGYKIITAWPWYFASIGKAYYKFKDYPKVIELMYQLLNTPRNINSAHSYGHWTAYNNLGLVYRALDNIDSSTYYFMVAAKYPDKILSNLTRSISEGNVGYNYYLTGKYTEAIPLMEADLRTALQYKDSGLAAGAAIPLADIKIKQGNLKEADALLRLAENCITTSQQQERLEQFFPVRSALYLAASDYKLSNDYKDSAINAIKRNQQTFGNLLLMRAQQRNNSEQRNQKQREFEAFKKLAQTRSNAIIIIFALLLAGFYIFFRHRRQLRIKEMRISELNNMLALRQTLSADMHDEIGSSLSSISLYAHSLLMQPQTPSQKTISEKIKTNAQQVQENISDIIWNVNPQTDSMDQVIARMRAFGADITESGGINFQFKAEESVMALKPDMTTRKNIYLIYKEAVNNAVKYSYGKNLEIAIKLCPQHFLQVSISDDGVGFNTEHKQSGNGLLNMRRRAEEINAELKITSKSEGGTVILLKLKIRSSG